jgi:hypothetical protein
MTIAIAWIRRIADCEELVLATDSRLSGDGRVFDAAPKILTLERGDCAIAFAGITQDAFPMMMQLSLAIGAHAPSRRRSLDIPKLKTHALKIFTKMGSLITSDAQVKGNPPDQAPAAEFLFGGYSWVQKRFVLWNIKYSEVEKGYVATAARWAYFPQRAGGLRIRAMHRPRADELLGRIAFAGDQATVAEALFVEILNNKRLADKELSKIDMEPFEVIVKMLRDSKRSPSIGGAPQIAKVYQFLTAVPFPVYWPTKEAGTRFLQGRPCLDYERLDVKVFDPDRPAW